MDFIIEKSKIDSWGFGAFLAVISPAIALLLLYFTFFLITSIFNIRPIEMERLYLLSLSVNLFLMRYYLVSTHQLKTGKSILAITFFMIITYFSIFNS